MKKTINRRKGNLRVVITIDTNRGYFSVTGHTSEGSCGCVHESILLVAPELKPIIDLHLRKTNGDPSHLLENGLYYINNSDRETVSRHFMVYDDETLDSLMLINTKERLSWAIDKLCLRDIWKAKVYEAKKLIESIPEDKALSREHTIEEYREFIDYFSDRTRTEKKMILASLNCDLLDYNDITNSDLDFADLLEAVDFIDGNDTDFEVSNYRFIHEDEIDSLFYDECKQTIEDCYDLDALTSLPSFIHVSIDWDKTISNCEVDGYGHQFSSYDGYTNTAGKYYFFKN